MRSIRRFVKMIVPAIWCVTLRDAGGEINVCLHAWGAEGAEGAEGEELYRPVVK
ncbi:MAG: hypothetical protein F6K41_15425 [Symploca sp. SIO3E6]|nr:hypothetical protein [Caldora sp. SIO3E6]